MNKEESQEAVGRLIGMVINGTPISEEDAQWIVYVVNNRNKCLTCGGKGTLGGCGSPLCDHTHTYSFCPTCN